MGLNSSSAPSATGKSAQAFLIFLMHSFRQPTFTEGSHMIAAWDCSWPPATSTNTCLRTHSCPTSRLQHPTADMGSLGCAISASQTSGEKRAGKKKEWTNMSSNKCPLTGGRTFRKQARFRPTLLGTRQVLQGSRL